MPAPTLRAHNVRTIEDRVAILNKLVFKEHGGLRDPTMRRLGLMVTESCRDRDDMCELRSIFDFVTKKTPSGRPNIRYTGDITGKDTFQSALRTLQFGGGDCDDHSVLNAVLAMENGFTTRFRITSNTGATWDHIYAMAAVPKVSPKRWVALDTTMGAGAFNREPPRAKYVDFPVK